MKSSFSICLLLCFSLQMIESRISYCPTPKITNGKFKYRLKAKFVKYTCNPGFILFGDKYNNCEHGKWDGPPPKCVRPGCKKVNAPNNGIIYPTHSGAVLHFHCKYGFQVHGPNMTLCNGTMWSSHLPICLPSNTKPSLTCDFENPDLCGWTHDLNHDFDWRRMQFYTPSGAIGTGPSHDHTLGKGKNGYYMYIESSSRNENDTARLISPVYEKTNNNTCFIFFYHMYGTTIGTLRVYLKKINEKWDFNPSAAFFQQHGDQGNVWIRSIHLFNPIPNDFQIIIEGARGDGYLSDIAIDDVSIVHNCNLADYEDAELSTTTEEISSTDFLPDNVFSCEGRCFSDEIPIGNHRMCSCHETCYYRSDCCPDFVDICVLALFDPLEGTPMDSSTIPSTTTTRKLTSPTTTSETDQTAKMPTSAYTEYTTNIISETKTFDISKSATTIIIKTTEENEIDEITDNQRTESEWKPSTEFFKKVPNYFDEDVSEKDVARLKKGYSKKKIVIPNFEDEGTSFVTYILLTFGIILICCIFILVMTKKGNRSRKFRSGSHGGSASDVRFLTSDELLDLNLAYE